MRRSPRILVAGLAIALAGAASADPAKPAKAPAAAAALRSINDNGTMKQCTDRGGKKACRHVAVFQGHNAARSTLRNEPLDRPSGDVWLYAENLGEEFKGNIYKDDGSFDDAALAKLDEAAVV